jgi:putative heme-binding domain-containing protein
VRLAAQTPADTGALARATAEDLAAGEHLFVTQCARCHGIGGTGGIGPTLTHPRIRHAPTDAALMQVILGGIPGTAMAGFWNLSEDEARQVAAYVRSLGRLPPEVVPGDAARGKRLYAERGRCASCHILRGVGAGWAPDLSEVGLRLSAAQLRQSLLDPGAAQPVSPLPAAHGPYPAYLVVEVTTRAGHSLRGTRISEDDFTLDLRGADGRFYSLDKATLRRIRKLPASSPMPAYGSGFSAAELDDLIAFLASQKGEP